MLLPTRDRNQNEGEEVQKVAECYQITRNHNPIWKIRDNKHRITIKQGKYAPFWLGLIKEYIGWKLGQNPREVECDQVEESEKMI